MLDQEEYFETAHHPDCPRYLEEVEAEQYLGRCSCDDCLECNGNGVVLVSSSQAGDQTLEEWEECAFCVGVGRVLKSDKEPI